MLRNLSKFLSTDAHELAKVDLDPRLLGPGHEIVLLNDDFSVTCALVGKAVSFGLEGLSSLGIGQGDRSLRPTPARPLPRQS